jgi:hypothetical protein
MFRVRVRIRIAVMVKRSVYIISDTKATLERLSCLVLSCLVLSCLILSCPVVRLKQWKERKYSRAPPFTESND